MDNDLYNLVKHDFKNSVLGQILVLELFLKNEFGIITQSQREMVEMLLESNEYMLNKIKNN